MSAPVDGPSGLSGFLGVRSVGKIRMTVYVTSAASVTIAAMYAARMSKPRAWSKAAVE